MKNFIKNLANKAGAIAIISAIILTSVPSITLAKKSSNGIDGVNTGGYSMYTEYSNPTYSYSSPGYSMYTEYSNPVYSYSPSSYYGGGSSYIPAPAQRYVYNTPTGGGGSTAGQLTYVYSSNKNENKNTNNNTNVISNTFNPTNNNDINVVILGGGGSNTNTQQNLDGNCVISPSIAYVNQTVSFSASATGGNGSYSYQWSGPDGINASSQSFSGRFSYAGTKSVSVVITSGSQSVTRTCSVTIQETYNPPVVGNAYCVATPANAAINQPVTWTAYVNGSVYGATSFSWNGTDGLYGNSQTITRSYQTPGYKTASFTAYVNGQSVTGTCATNINGYAGVTVIRDQNLGTPVSGVFLNQVPATGIGFGLKMTLFTAGLVLWSAFAAYVIARKTKTGAALAATAGAAVSSAMSTAVSKAEAFKLANMQKKGLIK
ncbi:MAG TPA: hypothetical protein VGE62_02205 [Candidatus Paceibacterota bacterium]